jgi:predicted metalloprotease with PDZ domain
MKSKAALQHLLALACTSLVACKSDPPLAATVESDPQPEVAYSLELVREPELAVRVSLDARGSDDGTSTFSLDEGWGGVENTGSNVRDVSIFDSSGVALALEHPTGHQWVVHHDRGERLRVTYLISANDRESSADPSIHYAPIVNEKLFHMIGNLGLMRLEHADGERTIDIGFEWKGFDAAGWNVVSSFGANAPKMRVHASLDEFRHAVFIAGDVRIHTKRIHDRPLVVAIAGHDWGFDDGEFLTLAASIVEAERAFFDDWDLPYYLISLIPVGKHEPGRISIGGTGLTHSFATFLLPGMELKAGSQDAHQVQHLLAHEMFHEWNGRIVRRVDPEELVYWFSEGFTEFFARRILYRSGLWTREQYAADVDASLSGYMLSPVRNENVERIRADFWKSRDVAELPYRRGDVVAMMLDHAIRERSHEQRSLDDLMRDLVAKGRTGARVDNDSLVADVARETDSEFAARVRRIVVDGETAELDGSTFGACLEMRMQPIGPFELGFDLEQSRKDGAMRGVRSGTRAYEAGLREGQRLRALSIHGNRPEIPVEVEVSESGTPRKITWLPQGDTVPVPQFSVRDGAADCSRL